MCQQDGFVIRRKVFIKITITTRVGMIICKNRMSMRIVLRYRYLMVYRNDSITRFNERFINYGFNKISYVETLRRYEYRFVLAGRVFAFDLPHLP